MSKFVRLFTYIHFRTKSTKPCSCAGKQLCISCLNNGNEYLIDTHQRLHFSDVVNYFKNNVTPAPNIVHQ